jgi:5-formyltetrahydrofolate cyclo-ligase
MAIDPAEERRQHRHRLLATREAMEDAAFERHSQAITARLIGRLCPFGAKTLAFYWPHRREYDPTPVALKVIEHGGQAALPVVVQKRAPLEFRPWHPDITMLIGAYEIPHPPEGLTSIPDAIIVPLLGFDDALYRLGYGGGYYDRTLAALSPRPLTIGVGFELSRLDTIHPQPHDIRLDMIITEDGVFEAPHPPIADAIPLRDR